MIYYSYSATPIGKLLLVAHYHRLMGVYHLQQTNCPIIGPDWQHKEDLAVFTHTNRQLQDYFRAKRTYFDVDYSLMGTPFQKEIWQHLKHIPHGKVMSYKAFAALTDYPHAIRIVAWTIAKNPLLILLPCHRIIGSNSTLGGYAAGSTIKQILLQLEQKYPDSKRTLSYSQ